MKKITIIIILFFAITIDAMAQHEHHNMQKQPTPKKQTVTQKKSAVKRSTPVTKQGTKKATSNPNSVKKQQPSQVHLQHDVNKNAISDTSRTDDHINHAGHQSDNIHESHGMTQMSGAHDQHQMTMSHAFSLNLPMNRNGSGTSWLPDNSPMYGYMVHANDWMFMFHGNIFIRYNSQDFTGKGSRGGSKMDAPNMFMAMGQRKIGEKGLFHFNTMFSLDAAIAGGEGYPLLFQSGETWNGEPLIDRQHPHDFFSELSVSYAHAFSKDADAFVYLGYPGEPALGAVTFMHRPSGMFNPDAPISHHWVDATHISFGVATVGVRYKQFKLEGSSFTGREPDENRYDFDKPLFDSRSARLSYNPDRYWALQLSHGFLNSPEVSHPGEDVYRTTASATHSRPIEKGSLDITGLWAQNKVPGEKASNAALVEASVRQGKLVLYSRYEWVQKSGEELLLDEGVFDHHEMYPINAITIGAGYDLVEVINTRVALGGQLSLYHADKRLDALYGKNPMAAEVYLHIYPKLMK
jgi:hypothetical protein